MLEPLPLLSGLPLLKLVFETLAVFSDLRISHCRSRETRSSYLPRAGAFSLLSQLKFFRYICSETLFFLERASREAAECKSRYTLPVFTQDKKADKETGGKRRRKVNTQVSDSYHRRLSLLSFTYLTYLTSAAEGLAFHC
jgi:hypothetical protein